MNKGLDKFCNKYYSLVGLPFRLDAGLYLKKTNSDGTISIIDLTKKESEKDGTETHNANG